jgi:VanZ family protein
MAGVACLSVFVIILAAGLWPFHVPANRVKWLKSEHGLQFQGHGSLISSGPFRVGPIPGGSEALEISLEPTRGNGGGTILSFDESAHPGQSFSVLQEGNALGILRNNVDQAGVLRTAVFYVHGVFKEKSPVFVTIALDSQESSVYVNGALTERFPHSLAGNDLTGRLVLANSPTADDSWAGKILGLALYKRRLTAAHIAADYAGWMANYELIDAEGQGASGLYLFDERFGAIVHNRVDPTTDLTIPVHYFILHPAFLRAPWKEYHQSWSYWQDIVVNVAGFVPFGFSVFAYLVSMRVVKYTKTITVIIGFSTSLTIEILQAFLPTRSSGVTDLITNTLGMAIGAIVCRRFIGKTVLTNARVTIAKKNSSETVNLESRMTVLNLTTYASSR